MQNLDFLEELNEQQESSVQGGLSGNVSVGQFLTIPFSFPLQAQRNRLAAGLTEAFFPGSVMTGVPIPVPFASLTFGPVRANLIFADSITVVGA